jgi:hypothetical protein
MCHCQCPHHRHQPVSALGQNAEDDGMGRLCERAPLAVTAISRSSQRIDMSGQHFLPRARKHADCHGRDAFACCHGWDSA